MELAEHNIASRRALKLKGSVPKYPVLQSEGANQTKIDLESERAKALYYWTLYMNKAI
jgi:hypothetical protein